MDHANDMDDLPLIDQARPCPRCGGRRLTVTIYMSSAYKQDILIRDDGAVEAESPSCHAHEEAVGSPSYLCRGCGHRWEG